MEKYDEASKDFSEAISLNPQYIDAYVQRGYVKSLNKDYKGVIDDSTIAINLDSQHQDFVPYNNRGLALFYLKQNEKALEDLNKCLKINPDYGPAYYNRGLVLGELNKNKEAVYSFDRAIEYQPDDSNSWGHRGDALLTLKKYEDAVDSYDKALKYKNDESFALYDKACIYGLQSNLSLAAANLKEAIKIDSKYIDYAKKDRDFDLIREQPEFQELLRF